jgi:hypothetical protein
MIPGKYELKLNLDNPENYAFCDGEAYYNPGLYWRTTRRLIIASLESEVSQFGRYRKYEAGEIIENRGFDSYSWHIRSGSVELVYSSLRAIDEEWDVS